MLVYNSYMADGDGPESGIYRYREFDLNLQQVFLGVVIGLLPVVGLIVAGKVSLDRGRLIKENDPIEKDMDRGSRNFGILVGAIGQIGYWAAGIF